MSWFSDVAKFEGFNLKKMLKQVGDDPERLLIGAGDEFGSKLWGKILGKDYDPIVDKWGGASQSAYDQANAAGINTGPGKDAHRIARAITAAMFAGGAMGDGGASATGLEGAGVGTGAAGGAAGGAGAAGAGAAGGFNMAATNPALIDSALGTAGYGASSAGAGGGAGQLASGGSSIMDQINNWRKLMPQQGGGNNAAMDRQRRQAELLMQMQQHDLQQQMNQKVPGWTR